MDEELLGLKSKISSTLKGLGESGSKSIIIENTLLGAWDVRLPCMGLLGFIRKVWSGIVVPNAEIGSTSVVVVKTFFGALRITVTCSS